MPSVLMAAPSRLLADPRARLAVLVIAFAALVLVALTVRLPDVDVLRAWLAGFGLFAPVAFVVCFALIVPTPIPKSLLNAVAGVAFGVAWGTVFVIAGAASGAVISFLAGRALGRDAVSRMAHGRLDRVDALVERHGVLAAVLVRVVPNLPFTVLNYACGVTAMRLRHFVIGTPIGMIPGTILVVTLAATGARISLWVPVLVSVGMAVVSLSVLTVWNRRRTGRADAGA